MGADPLTDVLQATQLVSHQQSLYGPWALGNAVSSSMDSLFYRLHLTIFCFSLISDHSFSYQTPLAPNKCHSVELYFSKWSKMRLTAIKCSPMSYFHSASQEISAESLGCCRLCALGCGGVNNSKKHSPECRTDGHMVVHGILLW